jgi:hypothetical protein
MHYTAIMEHNYTRRNANACAALGSSSRVCQSAKLLGWVRNRRADAAIDLLRREADVVMAFSNEEWLNRYRDDTPMFDVFDALDRQLVTDVKSLIAAFSGST